MAHGDNWYGGPMSAVFFHANDDETLFVEVRNDRANPPDGANVIEVMHSREGDTIEAFVARAISFAAKLSGRK